MKDKRDITNKTIIVQISKIYGNKVDKNDNLRLYKRENLEQAFNRYKTRNNIYNKSSFFYLDSESKRISLNKDTKIEELGLKTGDKIVIKRHFN